LSALGSKRIVTPRLRDKGLKSQPLSILPLGDGLEILWALPARARVPCLWDLGSGTHCGIMQGPWKNEGAVKSAVVMVSQGL